MGLVAMTGGQSVVITDTFASAGLEVPALSPASYAELKSFFNIIGGSYRNPLDAGGTIGMGHDQGNLDRILDILERDPAIDAIVLEIGTGLRAARWPAHEEELTGLLDKLAEFNLRSHKGICRDPASGPRRSDRHPRQGTRSRPQPGGIRQFRSRGGRIRRRRALLAGAERFVMRDLRRRPARPGAYPPLTFRRDHGESAVDAVAVEDHKTVGDGRPSDHRDPPIGPAGQHECLAIDDREGHDFAHRAARPGHE